MSYPAAVTWQVQEIGVADLTTFGTIVVTNPPVGADILFEQTITLFVAIALP